MVCYRCVGLIGDGHYDIVVNERVQCETFKSGHCPYMPKENTFGDRVFLQNTQFFQDELSEVFKTMAHGMVSMMMAIALFILGTTIYPIDTKTELEYIQPDYKVTEESFSIMSREYIQPSYSISIYDYQILKVQLTQLCATAERSTIETLYEHFEDEVYPRAGILKITGKVASIAEDYFSGNGILLTSSGNVEKMALYVHHPEKIGVKLGDSVTLVCSPEYEGRVMPLQVRGWYQI